MNKKIAIVGYSFRLPGADPTNFWACLTEGQDLVTRVPEDRWSREVYLHPRRSEPGTSYTFAAGTLGDVSGFDAAFFGISPREAEQMDPQQRLVLELTWEAFERGGIPPSSVRGSRGAVYLGFSASDYAYRRADDLASIDASTMTGNTASVAANRISYQFDLRGPSMAIDTACSSSLVAFHQACQSIRHGESPLAVVGGVSLHLHPYAFIGFSKASMLSRRGICSVFDAAGDGYVRSEGAGIFILKELGEALADGNRVYAIVAASGVNCDGRTNGLTVPGCETQAALLRELYADAGIDPAEIDYVEAHGTGTAVGDPIETRALGLALGQLRPPDSPLLVGSVKSNLGHLEAASGAAGLVKALACLEHRCVPPTIHLEEVNPNIDLEDWNLAVVTENTRLAADRGLTIGINSFGFGGANAHVILQSPPPSAAQAAQAPAGIPPLVLSARSPEALRAVAGAYAQLLRDRPDEGLYDLAFSAAFHREQHGYRAVAPSEDREALLAGLAAFARGGDTERVAHGVALAVASRPVFVYSGNGSQWAGMGASLLDADPVFRQAVHEVDALFRRFADFSILDELRAEEGADRLALTEVAQPALFAVQVGITEMLRAWGASPAAVVGHSVGEVAAAWACGALSLQHAVHVIAERSAKQGTTRGTGGMTAVGMSADAARSMLQETGLANRLWIAGINSPRGVTLAGGVDALQEFERHLAEREVFLRRLKLDYAFHSPAMDALAAPLQQALHGLRPRGGGLPFYSTVTGNRLGGDRLGATYWWRNVREPVQFESAITALIADGHNLFVEVGPSAILRNYVSDSLRKQSVEGRVIPTMARADDRPDTLRQALLQLLTAGAPIDLERLFPVRGRFVDIPTYPWQHQRYWHPVTAEAYELINRRKAHPLLGYRLKEHEAEWENQIDTTRYPNLRDHVVGDAVVFPAAGYIEMVLAAAGIVQGSAQQELEELEIRMPLLLKDSGAKTVRLRIDGSDGHFTIRSRDRLSDDPWLVNVVGRLLGSPSAQTAARRLVPPQRPADLPGREHYRLAAEIGLAYGPAFQTVDRIWHDGGGVVAKLTTPPPVAAEYLLTRLHPAYLDGCFQLLVDMLRADVLRPGSHALIPVKVGRLVLRQPGAAVVFARATLLRRGPRSVAAAFVLHDADGAVVAELGEVRFRAVQLRKRSVDHADFLTYRAVPRPRVTDQAVAPLPPVDDLVSACRRRLHDSERMAERRAYHGEVEPLLDVLCASFAEQALRQIVPEGRPVDPERLIASGRVASSRRLLLHGLVDVLEEEGVLEPAEAGWEWAPDSGLPAATDVWISMLGDYPDYAAELFMVGRMGLHLAEVLAGSVDGTALVPPGCTGTLLEHYSGSSPSMVDLHLAVADLMRLAMARLPPGRRLRVLEWCSCRSQLTTQAVPALDLERCDYVLAAPREDVLEERGAFLESHPEVQTRLLRLDGNSRDGAGQVDLFDLVLVSTDELDLADAERLFGLLRQRVAGGGLVVLLGQFPARWMDLAFGWQSSWWAVEAGRHVHSRTRTPAQWQALATAHGFNGVAALHDVPGIDSGAYLLLLRNRNAVTVAAEALPVPSGTWILLQDPHGYGAALADLIAAELRNQGHTVVAAMSSQHFAVVDSAKFALNPCLVEQVGELLSAVRDLHGDVGGVVHLCDLHLERAAGSAEAQFAAQQRRCISTVALLQACDQKEVTPRCWLVTARATLALLPESVRARLGARLGDVADAPLWGLGRTSLNEYPQLSIRLVDLADPDRLERMAAGLLAELLSPDAEDEIILTGDGRYAPRLRAGPMPSRQGADDVQDPPTIARLDFSQPGPLKNLVWRAQRLATPRDDEVEIEVRAVGLNFRDVMYAMGLISDEAVESGFAGPTLGMELAGVVREVGSKVVGFRPGDEVIAFAPASFSSRVLTKAGAVVPKPAGWSFEAAATIPIAFFTVYYALHRLAQLQAGERILIHGAAGGVGIAAIQLAKHNGAEIFATAGSAEKRDFVRMLGADHVMDSRSLAFADEILELTGGQGVDVVLNSLAGEAINRNLRVLRPFGRFLELGKRDFYENTRIGLRPFRNNISYFGIDADQLMIERPDLAAAMLGEMMTLFEQGVLKPLPFRAFAANDVVDAFRHMQQSRQIGKVVISFRGGAPVAVPAPGAARSLQLPAEATYLVTGGLSGFGLRTAQWLASKGARHLVLLGRRGAASAEAQAAVSALRASGVEVHAPACDVTRREALAEVLKHVASAMPPLRGVVHAAMVIADGLLRSQDQEKFHKVLAPKILGARHLHDLTLALPLDFFVLYSSATTLFGNPGQGNYVAANQYLEALAATRRGQGLPAVCLSWGVIDDVGYLARHGELKDSLQSRMGGSALHSDEALRVLEQALLCDQSGLGVTDFDWAALRRFLPTSAAPKYEHMARHAEDLPAEGEGLAAIRRLLAELAPEELQAVFTDLLKREVAEILHTSPERLDENRSMYDQGMDSLMGMELVAAVEARFGVNLPIMALSEGPTIARLVSRIIRELEASEGGTGEPDADLQEQVRGVAMRHVGLMDAEAVRDVAAAVAGSGASPKRRPDSS